MLTEQEMTSESLQLAPGAGLPFDAAVHNLEIASVWISPEEPSRRVASRRRKLAASPIVMSPDTVQKLMRKELEARSTPTPRRVGGAKKSDALKRLKMLRPVTPISSVSSSPSEGDMPSSSSLCDLPQNDEGASSSPMQRVGKLLSKVINEEKKPAVVTIVTPKSPTRRPNFSALSYEDLEESMSNLDTWSPPPPHTYVRELGPHVPPPLPITIVTPERGSEQVRSKLASLKKKEKGGLKGKEDELRMSQEKASRRRNKGQGQQAIETPNSPPTTARGSGSGNGSERTVYPTRTNENLDNALTLPVSNLVTPPRSKSKPSKPGSNQRFGSGPSPGRQLRKSIAEDVLGRLALVETALEDSLI